jgi:hypothetical protein
VCAREGLKRWRGRGRLRLDNGAAVTVTFEEFLYSTVTIDRIRGHYMDFVHPSAAQLRIISRPSQIAASLNLMVAIP